MEDSVILTQQGDGTACRMSAEEMDEKRKQNIAYEYLCHLEEANVWIAACINEKLPATTDLEEFLRNGVYLAKLAHFFAPDIVSLKKIYDKDQTRYRTTGTLHFRYTDNINLFFRSMEHIGFPKVFYPETTDIYDKKNMPKVTYCLHGLSLFLFKLGIAPQIEDLYGKVHFTEEEISAMRKELEKYGIQMPAFSKIGGILTNEMPEGEAEMHAAIIAINDALQHQLLPDTLNALHIPQACLCHVVQDYIQDYQTMLYDAKQTKAEIARNKSIELDGTYQPDVYDEMLTQAELQGNINKINVMNGLVAVTEAVRKDDTMALMSALLYNHLGVRDVEEHCEQYYMDQLKSHRINKLENNNYDNESMFDKDEVQLCLTEANMAADRQYQRQLAVAAINVSLEDEDSASFLKSLDNPSAQLPAIHEFALDLYYQEFLAIRNDKGSDLEYNEILGGVKVLSAVARINEALESGSDVITWHALQHPNAHLFGLDQHNDVKYHERLMNEKISRQQDDCCPLLSHVDIQACIDIVNGDVREENEKVSAIAVINEAVEQRGAAYTSECLKAPQAKLEDVEDQNAYLYQMILSKAKIDKAKDTHDESAVLWYEEIQNAVQEANIVSQQALKTCICVAAISRTIEEEDSEQLLSLLTSRDARLAVSINTKCSDNYLEELKKAKSQKCLQGDVGSGWLMTRTTEGYKLYYNVHTDTSFWQRPSDGNKDHSLLTREEIQSVVSDVTDNYNRCLLFEANEAFVVTVQARCRGFLVRTRVQNRLQYLKSNESDVVKIQACWRGTRQRQKYNDRLAYLRSNTDAIVQIQSFVRMWLAKRKHRHRLRYYKDHTDAVVKIQSFIRSNKARKDFQTLIHNDNPSLHVVRKFVHLLENSDVDYTEEIELQKIREQVVSEIRLNHKLEEDLNKMDIKIGLLVKNRITLQDVVRHNKKLTDLHECGHHSLGLKGLSKESREKLDAYQHLFYLLQTKPSYLAKLIFEMPQSKTTVFMESVILALYNYASNNREEYLLLKLFTTALDEEISRLAKVDKMSEIVTGNPMVVKMTVDFNRNARGHSCLRELLNPLVNEVLERKDLRINTNPSDVYKQWINQLESETGRASGLPYDVTVPEALEHEVVRQRINTSVENLKCVTERFLNAIIKSLDKIPYGMRYVAKVMKNSLHEKFPEAPEKDVLKIVGNLLYYRYINSAIVAPDAFDIITVGANKGLTNDQRRNLGSIAKILQFAASNKGYGGESEYLASLNPYIRDAHEKFKFYFRAACEVDEPEVHFNMDKYSDWCMVAKPVIYMSLGEMLDTHQLLMEHQDKIAPNHDDPLHEILEELGDVSEVEILMGGESAGQPDVTTPEGRDRLAKVETMLTLTNKYQVEADDKAELKNTLVRTKRMVVDVIRVQGGDSIMDVLNTEATDKQEELHQAFIRDREKSDQKVAIRTSKLIKQQSMIDDNRMSIGLMKKRIRCNLETLSSAGVTSPDDNYQFLINSLVQDIRNQRLYRQRRKHEMLKLKTTLHSLHNKRTFYEEQIDYYDQYVSTCLRNLAKNQRRPKSRLSWFGSDGKKKAPLALKYSAAKLYEKGVLLEIDGLPQNQFKNLVFDILPRGEDEPGVFEVYASFMGVNMDKVNVILQDLLRLQYEGVAVMKMFNRTKVNVNLMIFLLNKKFYGK